MTKSEKLIKEFDKAHSEYSIKNLGHFKLDWKSKLKHTELKDGFWYWKGHRLADLEVGDK